MVDGSEWLLEVCRAVLAYRQKTIGKAVPLLPAKAL